MVVIAINIAGTKRYTSHLADDNYIYSKAK